MSVWKILYIYIPPIASSEQKKKGWQHSRPPTASQKKMRLGYPTSNSNVCTITWYEHGYQVQNTFTHGEQFRPLPKVNAGGQLPRLLRNKTELNHPTPSSRIWRERPQGRACVTRATGTTLHTSDKHDLDHLLLVPHLPS